MNFIIAAVLLLFCVLLHRLLKYFNFKSFKVENSIVVITGSASDLGRNLCYQFAKKKCQIICIDKDEPKNNNTVRVIKQFHPECNIKSFICDVSQYDQVQKVFQEILAEFKHVDILINNVAINICKEFIEDYTETQIKDILNTNVLSHFWTTKEILPSMEKRDIGYIVGISSIAGIAAIKHINPYCASKFAVTGFMQSLENQLRANKSNIRTLSVRPYFMVTQMVNPKMLNHRIERVLDPPAVAQKIFESIENGETRLIIPFYIWYLEKLDRLFPFIFNYLLDNVLEKKSIFRNKIG